MKWLKVGGVIFGAVAITALGIDAADTLQGSRSTLLGQIVATEHGACPSGMQETSVGGTFTCVDIYEASASDDCEYQNPGNEAETRSNLENTQCGAVSKKDTQPWRYITREQAQAACLRSGKRLPDNKEWYIVSAGTPDTDGSCNIDSAEVSTSGKYTNCVSGVGVYDAIGNVWEWTIDDVINGNYAGRELPQTGYVTQVDAQGIAITTEKNTGSEQFYEDYFWSDAEGAYGILRGGFYGSKEDAGVYATHAQTLPTSAGTAIGFRCVK